MWQAALARLASYISRDVAANYTDVPNDDEGDYFMAAIDNVASLQAMGYDSLDDEAYTQWWVDFVTPSHDARYPGGGRDGDVRFDHSPAVDLWHLWDSLEQRV